MACEIKTFNFARSSNGSLWVCSGSWLDVRRSMLELIMSKVLVRLLNTASIPDPDAPALCCCCCVVDDDDILFYSYYFLFPTFLFFYRPFLNESKFLRTECEGVRLCSRVFFTRLQKHTLKKVGFWDFR